MKAGHVGLVADVFIVHPQHCGVDPDSTQPAGAFQLGSGRDRAELRFQTSALQSHDAMDDLAAGAARARFVGVRRSRVRASLHQKGGVVLCCARLVTAHEHLCPSVGG